MQRIVAFTVIGLVLVSCDPVYPTSASGQIPAPLERTCVIETLRMEKTVRSAGTYTNGAKEIYAELIIPQDLDGSSHPNAIVEERNENGRLYIYFVINFVPDRGSPEYQTYVQKVLNELRDRTIEKCNRK